MSGIEDNSDVALLYDPPGELSKPKYSPENRNIDQIIGIPRSFTLEYSQEEISKTARTLTRKAE